MFVIVKFRTFLLKECNDSGMSYWIDEIKFFILFILVNLSYIYIYFVYLLHKIINYILRLHLSNDISKNFIRILYIFPIKNTMHR